jgi:hypothetical protein
MINVGQSYLGAQINPCKSLILELVVYNLDNLTALVNRAGTLS